MNQTHLSSNSYKPAPHYSVISTREATNVTVSHLAQAKANVSHEPKPTQSGGPRLFNKFLLGPQQLQAQSLNTSADNYTAALQPQSSAGNLHAPRTAKRLGTHKMSNFQTHSGMQSGGGIHSRTKENNVSSGATEFATLSRARLQPPSAHLKNPQVKAQSAVGSHRHTISH